MQKNRIRPCKQRKNRLELSYHTKSERGLIQMRAKSLIQALTGTSHIVCESIENNEAFRTIKIIARPDRKSQCRCGFCQKKCPLYDKGKGKREWRCLDIGGAKAYIVSESPRVSCKEHGVVTAHVPWARHGSRFCISFEDTVTWLSMNSPKKTVAEYMRIEWHTVGEIISRTYKELKSNAPDCFENLVNIGIDETSYKKGHEYMTVVVNHDTNSVVWCAVGYGKEVLKTFFEALSESQRKSIRCVSADGARWIADCVTEYCPQAERCIDPFHVVSWATEILDTIRKQAWSEAHHSSKEALKRKRGRPKKGEEESVEKKQSKTFKTAKYALLKNPEDLTEHQKEQLQFLTVANPRLYRAYLLKENLRLALKAGADSIGELIDKWMSWAQRCRIPEYRELRKKIKRHLPAILATAKHHLSNARIEATNNKIKLIIHKSYGFRNTDNMLAMVMLSCSNVHPMLPGRA